MDSYNFDTQVSPGATLQSDPPPLIPLCPSRPNAKLRCVSDDEAYDDNGGENIRNSSNQSECSNERKFAFDRKLRTR